MRKIFILLIVLSAFPIYGITVSDSIISSFTGNGNGLTNLPCTAINGTAVTNAGLQSATNGILATATNSFDAAGAAQAATNNFGTTVAVNLTNATNQFTGTFTGNAAGLTNLDALRITATNAPSQGDALHYDGTNFYWAH